MNIDMIDTKFYVKCNILDQEKYPDRDSFQRNDKMLLFAIGADFCMLFFGQVHIERIPSPNISPKKQRKKGEKSSLLLH